MSEPVLQPKANKGEWSEFYVLLKLVADKKLFAADENLEPLEGIFYPVIKAISAKGTPSEVQYNLDRDTDAVTIIVPADGTFKSEMKSSNSGKKIYKFILLFFHS